MRRFLILTLFLFGLSIPSTGFAATLSVSPSGGGVFSWRSYFAQSGCFFKRCTDERCVGSHAIPSALFSIDSISKGGSILNFWLPNHFSQIAPVRYSSRCVALWVPKGAPGQSIIVNLRARKVGSGTVSFQSGQILANDGQGTDITRDVIGGTFQIAAKGSTCRPTCLHKK